MRFNFDFISFLIGFGSASAIAAALYRLRARIAALIRRGQASVASGRKFVTRTSNERYRIALIKQCQGYHIAGETVELSEILVQPRFLRAPSPYDPDEADEAAKGVMHVLPQVHDWPMLYAPYNVETLSIDDLGAGDKHLALLGMPGLGKSTTLAVLAMYALGEFAFEKLEDIARQASEAVREGESEEDARARELAMAEIIKQAEQSDEARAKRQAVDFTALVPILVHLADINLDPESVGAKLDPAEPLVRAVQGRFGPLAANTIPGFLYDALNGGVALVLIDGYDDLPAEQRAEKIAWLEQFMALYAENWIVATGPANGYGPLAKLGLTPVYLRAWSDVEQADLADRWAAAWPVIAGTRREPAPAPDKRIMRRAKTDMRGLSPLDATLKVWAAFTGDGGDAQQTNRLGWYGAYIARRLANPDYVPALVQIAANILEDDGYTLHRDQVKTIIAEAFTGPEGKPTINVDGFLSDLARKYGVMVIRPGRRMTFKHPAITGYLAAQTLASGRAEALPAYARDARWEIAMTFAGGVTDLTPAVRAALQQPPHLLYDDLLMMARWLADSDPSASWRGEVLRRLGQVLMTPSQYPALRERATGALVAARDLNVLFVFRQALRAVDPLIRKLGCIGLGALGSTEAIKDLNPMLVDDDADVQLAAALALGAIGSEAAMKVMVQGLLEEGAGDHLKRAVTEAFAALAPEGHAVLKDAADHDEMEIRRAAVFGLSRVREPWALGLLYQMLTHEDQWYVRSAAQNAFSQAQNPDALGPTAQPPADQITWLVAWAAEKGQGVPTGLAANDVLIRALQEGDPAHRQAAASALAELGHVPALHPLYGALRDDTPGVREWAHRALADLQSRTGEPLPGVN